MSWAAEIAMSQQKHAALIPSALYLLGMQNAIGELARFCGCTEEQ